MNMENEKHFIYVRRNCNVTLRLAGVSFLRRNIVMESCYFFPPFSSMNTASYGSKTCRRCRTILKHQSYGQLEKLPDCSGKFSNFYNFFLGATPRIGKPVGTNLRKARDDCIYIYHKKLLPEHCAVDIKGKGKVHPRTGHENPEGE